MSKIHKVEFYIVDPNDVYNDGEDLIDSINERLYDGWMLNPKWKTSKEIDWHDDIDLNFSDCSEADCEKYFTK
ncbi:MAG: hypothetical protein IJO27_00415 [Bacilli bacterium]|nr:hypothetical protein [Bacilli bacterium]